MKISRHLHSIDFFSPPGGNEGERKEWMSLKANLDNVGKRKTYDMSGIRRQVTILSELLLTAVGDAFFCDLTKR